jgi:hypothetical protein
LDSQDLLIKYINNKPFCPTAGRDSVSTGKMLEISDPEYYLTVAFRFDSTPEGFKFWSEIHKSWTDHIIELTIANIELGS